MKTQEIVREGVYEVVRVDRHTLRVTDTSPEGVDRTALKVKLFITLKKHGIPVSFKEKENGRSMLMRPSKDIPARVVLEKGVATVETRAEVNPVTQEELKSIAEDAYYAIAMAQEGKDTSSMAFSFGFGNCGDGDGFVLNGMDVDKLLAAPKAG